MWLAEVVGGQTHACPDFQRFRGETANEAYETFCVCAHRDSSAKAEIGEAGTLATKATDDSEKTRTAITSQTQYAIGNLIP